MERYTRSQLAKMIRVPVRRIERWASADLRVLEPSRGRRGKGNPHEFTFAEAVRAAVAKMAEDGLGFHFRPGSLTKALRTPDFDALCEKERDRIMEGRRQQPPATAGHRDIRQGDPEDKFVFVYRPRAGLGLFAPPRGRLNVAVKARRDLQSWAVEPYVALYVDLTSVIKEFVTYRAIADATAST